MEKGGKELVVGVAVEMAMAVWIRAGNANPLRAGRWYEGDGDSAQCVAEVCCRQIVPHCSGGQRPQQRSGEGHSCGLPSSYGTGRSDDSAGSGRCCVAAAVSASQRQTLQPDDAVVQGAPFTAAV